MSYFSPNVVPTRASLFPTVVKSVDIPYTITSPGYYLLEEDISGAGQLITIGSNDVVLDLGGRIVTTGQVYWSGTRRNIAIRNGVFMGSATHAIENIGSPSTILIENIVGMGLLGVSSIIYLRNAINATVRNVYTLGGLGIVLDGGAGGVIQNCHSVATGVNLSCSMSDSVVTECSAMDGFGTTSGISLSVTNDNYVINCDAMGMGEHGFNVDTNGEGCFKGCIAGPCGLSGYRLGAFGEATLTECAAVGSPDNMIVGNGIDNAFAQLDRSCFFGAGNNAIDVAGTGGAAVRNATDCVAMNFGSGVGIDANVATGCTVVHHSGTAYGGSIVNTVAAGSVTTTTGDKINIHT